MCILFSQAFRVEMSLQLIKIELRDIAIPVLIFFSSGCKSWENIHSVPEKTPICWNSYLQLWFCQNMHGQLFSSPWELLTKYKPYLTNDTEATFSLANIMPTYSRASRLSLSCGVQAKINYVICNFNQCFTNSSDTGLPAS